jgi:hypothetical protein
VPRHRYILKVPLSNCNMYLESRTTIDERKHKGKGKGTCEKMENKPKVL